MGNEMFLFSFLPLQGPYNGKIRFSCLADTPNAKAIADLTGKKLSNFHHARYRS